ncbi:MULTISPECIES: outer membrane protein assembly factor BamE [unclassified Sphingobium]|uniref:outer membrane protein assembly factor BamE n=1 Tax=unclassified Sphingobium TaxID=2611147 RepID=UPI0022254254|nr:MULTISPECIES: outer membrane protein assembly factor BamE [unclassified Sphingobium]MCW2351657.1 outer membrane protein assembly factor BamE (lipoprotein component of BamABCDE complex) [Sphingobium sp. B12D2B]MCW2370923.1 outer membrane protein assembly factor BamE (lipoprotein component of BamABCDE complex) [Sphingobium sp. B11D3D]MCW2380524.1 outer membrane protein assembly factor BamE (lipoprotein component of BamABCDE complex) [Sphingobium sp. B2D3B]MCW2399369.1 outer membrane protein as
MQRGLRRPFLVVGAAAILLLAGGCTRIRAHQGFMIDDLIVSSVLPGVDNKASVEGALGRPTFVSQFGPERWYYVARDTRSLAFASPRPTAQTLVTVQFDANGNVATIDRNATLDQVANISPTGATTPTLGRKRSLFDEIFGNIGAVGAGGAGAAGPSQ